ncbi:MAG TPA: hypothetical protein VMI54_14990 [Polyangiaceae bacterium]|nr:hypothetical protein [Polyangiaceae bacterium]
MPRLPTLFPTLLLFGDLAALVLALLVGSPQVALGAAGPAGIVAVIACELLARRDRLARVTVEPWRLDGWAALVATLAVLGVGACIGPEASGIVWLLVALVAGLGFASFPNLAPRARP